VAYDVKVGTAPDFVLQSDDETVRKQASLYRYKIDVIGFKGNQIDIIELKQSATMRAIGQVKGYRKLYVRDVDANARGEDIIITDLLLPDMEHLAAEENVKVVVV
jgi:RecB family endonuclease NucS